LEDMNIYGSGSLLSENWSRPSDLLVICTESPFAGVIIIDCFFDSIISGIGEVAIVL